jgi:hypothetical protein
MPRCVCPSARVDTACRMMRVLERPSEEAVQCGTKAWDVVSTQQWIPADVSFAESTGHAV